MVYKQALMAQLDEHPTGDQEIGGFKPPYPQTPPAGSATFFVEIDHKIFSTVILSLSLIQEGQLSVFGERMHTILRLTA